MSMYQGLFYLLLGFSFFLSLLLILRLLGESNESQQSLNTNDSWSGKQELEIVDIISEVDNVKTFRLKRKGNKEFGQYLAGQFLSFQIKDDPKLLRSYSFSGSVENKSTIQVSIKKLDDGVGSSWFHGLSIGDVVLAYPPSGNFTDENQDIATRRVFVAGGIGITPLISMIKTNIDRSIKTPMSLFYGMRSVDDLVFHQELLNLAQSYDYFQYYPLLSDNSDGWSGDTGFITYEYIKSKVNLDQTVNFYFCGPPVMTDSISESLLSSGFAKEQLHSEVFASPSDMESKDIEPTKVKVDLDGNELSYAGTDTILEFLEDSGVDIDFACRSGVCGACKCKLLEGEVDSISDSGLTPSEVKSGFILTCVSRPKGDIKISIE